MIDKEIIKQIVKTFYTVVTNDIIVGFHFQRIQNLAEHISRITHFWEIQLLGKGTTMEVMDLDLIRAHENLNVNRGQLDRFVLLFHQTIDQYFQQCNLPDKTQLELDLNKWKEKILRFKKLFRNHPRMVKP